MTVDNGSATSNRETADAPELKAPSITLPQGGGALRGIDEKFAANPVTGAGALTVAIPTSPGRSGFDPKVSLAYDSSSGNGPFGFGWNLSLPSIIRRTDKGSGRPCPQGGLPRYADYEESDIFVLSGAEDLVPQLHQDHRGHWIDEPIPPRNGYSIKAYRPRTEGLFARIERWTRLDDGATHWRSISKDNIQTIYGLDANSQIADPDNPTRVFSWLICRSFDDKGNAIVYDYVEENDAGVDFARTNERRRSRQANRYLHRIRYGNRGPLTITPTQRPTDADRDQLNATSWMFSLVLDYGEGRYHAEKPDADGQIYATASYHARHPWPVRRDPFSSYRARFEVRTNRLCRRALMFHHFPTELGDHNYLVRSTSFAYDETPTGSYLHQVEQSGHRQTSEGSYLTRSLPTLQLGYTSSPLDDPDHQQFDIRDVDEDSLRNLPTGIGGSGYRFVDLHGVGISGVLTEQEQTWWYKPNLGDARFGATELLRVRPALATLSDGTHHLMDLAGDGDLDLVDLSSSSPGYYERDDRGNWAGFRAFGSLPTVNWGDPNVRFVDVTGDGITDVLITEDDAFKWHPSLLTDGFGAAVRVHIPLDEEESGPRAIFADGTQSIYLASMTGDGLSDIVRIRNGEICYWPNLGYGQFGAKITMDHAPRFDTASDLFDQHRIRLADTDGSGTTDILYLADHHVEVYLNEAGNSWAPAKRIGPLPAVDDLATIDVMDFLGRGTACLVWSSPLPCEQGRQLRYIDLMCGRKPHLLERIDDQSGTHTHIQYASSTEFYLADQAAGTPWVTRLPFPVHVVTRVQTYDEVSGNRFVSRYTYHHGFYDGLEREFRGFGRVDKLDTEDIAALTAPGRFPTGNNIDAASTVPPVLTKTWIHTGVFLDSTRISRHLEHEYFPDHTPLTDTALPTGLTPYEAREACRALKGSTLRQEIYALDGTARAHLPYSVADNNFTIRTVQPIATNRYAVFFTHPRETLTHHYERNHHDPRIGHTLTLAVDDYGNVLTSASIGYRRQHPEIEEQDVVLATLAEHQFTNPVQQPDTYRTPRPAQASLYEFTAPQLCGAQLLTFDAVKSLAAAAREISYDHPPTAGQIEKRLTSRHRLRYRSDDLRDLLEVGHLQSKALPGQRYTLALTPGLIDIFGAKATPLELQSILRTGHYRDLDADGNFWRPSGQVFYTPNPVDAAAELDYAREHFFLPHRFVNAFGNTTTVGYDTAHNLCVVYTRDAIGNQTTCAQDYRVLQPHSVTDPNGNRAQARFDALGMLAGTVLLGKALGPVEGDSFEHFNPDPTPAQTNEFFDAADPRPMAGEHLGTATTRIIYDFNRRPMSVASIARETHVADLAPGQTSRTQLHFTYSDGFGREVQSKVQAEPGPLNPDDPHTPHVNPRWVGSGAKVYNNKGKPVREYEPFFCTTPQFGIKRRGVSNTLFYDPVLRVVAIWHPNNSYEKVVFDPWKQERFDVNDTVTFDPTTDPDVGEYFSRITDSEYLPTWYQHRIDGAKGPSEQSAAIAAARHANTPTVAHFDSLGRTVLEITDNGEGQRFPTRTALDIEGNQLTVTDPLQRVIVRSDYDMLGTQIHQASMDAGQRWALNDVAGKPLRAWTSRGQIFRTEYDELRRPVRSYLNAEHLPHEILYEQTIYGDSEHTGLSEALRRRANLLGKPFRHFDSAGVVVTERNDFKGNPLRSTRQLTCQYKHLPDWSHPQPLDSQIYLTEQKYDALNRVIAQSTPDGSMYRPTFNEANLLETVHVNLRGAAHNGDPSWTVFITNINYDAKGQRTVCRYANGVHTTYEYDPQTFRLARLTTTRTAIEHGASAQIFKQANLIQDLRYTYDPVGNITRIDDDALKTVFHANQHVDASCEYTYDPTYRLIAATGREHIGQSGFSLLPRHGDDRDYPFDGAKLTDLQAIQRYTEHYDYDPAGNFRQMAHRSAHRNWTREYRHREPNPLEPATHSNRLSETILNTRPDAPIEHYSYDANGNTTQMPHLPVTQWNAKDQLSSTARQVTNTGTPVTTYYVYDATGQRARKVTESECGNRISERIYIGGFEVFREYCGPDIDRERETLHILDGQHRIALVETLTVESAATVTVPSLLQRYQLANHLSSACIELDEAGGLITYEEYSPYGNTTYQAGSAREVKRKRYRYTAKERDDENGFSYHGARYYAPWLGTWISSDPIGLRGGLNSYQYTKSNPITFTDPRGTDPVANAPKEFLPGLITDYPHLGQAWRDSASKVLERTFGKGSYAANMDAFRAAIDALPEGPARSKYARKLFDSARSGFYQRVGQLYKEGKKVLGNIALPQETVDKMIKDGTAPAAGVQIDHTIDELARNPKEALNEMNLGLRQGHAGVPRGSHYAVTEARKDLRAAEEAKAAVNEGKEVAGAALKTEGKEAASAALKTGGKEAAEVVEKAGLKQGAKWLGGKAAKFIPVAGIFVGIALVSKDVHAGDYAAAAWDAGEAVPGAGDAVGLVHLVTIGAQMVPVLAAKMFEGQREKDVETYRKNNPDDPDLSGFDQLQKAQENFDQGNF